MAADFFPPIPAPPRRHDPQPEWAGPPEDLVGRFVPIAFVLARSDTAAVLVDGVRAYPTGCVFTVTAVLRPGQEEAMHGSPMHPGPHGREGDELLRVAVELADGRRAYGDTRAAARGSAAGSGAVLQPRGGGGGGGRYSGEFWLWPLPPEGPLTFVCRWRSEGIELARHRVDAGPIREAAAQPWRIWED